MKRVTLKFFTAFFVLFAVLSCKDQFTTEELLNQQQLIDLAIYVVDYTAENEPPVPNAKVVISQGHDTREATTNENGVAVFEGVKLGGFAFNIGAENYTSISGNGDISTNNFRESQITFREGLYSLTSENLATIKGTIKIEKDVTNEVSEFASGIEIRFDVDLDEGEQVFTTTTDENGNYEIKIPVDAGGSYVEISYPDFELEQTIAYYEDDQEPYYKGLKPTVGFKTLFSHTSSGAENYEIAVEDIRTLVATVEAPPEGGEQAYISSVYVNDDGEITGVNFSDGGDYGDEDEVTVTFHSIAGGSGATLVIDPSSDGGDLDDAYDNDNFTLEGGSGYPNDEDDNRYFNKIGYQGPSFDTGETIYPGKIRFINGDYGTGIYRTKYLADD